MKARAAGGEGGHAPGHNGDPEQGPDGADTSHDAFFSRNTIGTDPHGAARQEGRDSAGGTHPPLSGLSASDSPTGKTRLVVCVTEVRGNNTYIAKVAAPVTYVADTRRCATTVTPTPTFDGDSAAFGDESLRRVPAGR
jgi:hypothetical protein